MKPSRYIYIYTTIVGERLSTSVLNPAVSFIPSFPPSLLASLLPCFLPSLLVCFLASILPSFLPSLLLSFLLSFLPSFLPSLFPLADFFLTVIGITISFDCYHLFFDCNDYSFFRSQTSLPGGMQSPSWPASLDWAGINITKSKRN